MSARRVRHSAVVVLDSYLLLTTLVASALNTRESAATLGLGGAIVALVTVVVSDASRAALHDAALALWGTTVGALVAHTSRELGALHCDDSIKVCMLLLWYSTRS